MRLCNVHQRFGVWCICAVILLTFSGPLAEAKSKIVSSEAQATLQESMELRSLGKYEQAADLLLDLIVKEKAQMEVLGNAYCDLIYTYILIGDEGRAARSAREALLLFPELAPDPLLVPVSTVGTVLDQARIRLYGSLTIETDPDSCLVYLDDEKLGLTPLNLEYVEGKNYKMTISRDGYAEIELNIQVLPGSSMGAFYNLRSDAEHSFDQYLSISQDHMNGLNLIYMPRWAHGFFDGEMGAAIEADYHSLMLGYRRKLSNDFSVLGAVGFYINDNKWIGPDYLPLLLQVQRDVHRQGRLRTYLLTQYTYFHEMESNDWEVDSGSSDIHALGLGAGVGYQMFPGFFVSLQGSWEFAGSRSFTTESEILNDSSELDFSGFQTHVSVEITF